MSLALIWAQAQNGVIGAGGALPWHVPEDLAHFKELTWGTPVVMGRRTWDSFPDRFRPLPGRDNIVLTRDPAWSAPGATVVHSLPEALSVDVGPVKDLDSPANGTRWVIGGAQLYAATIDLADRLEVTEIAVSPRGDAEAPVIDSELWTRTPGADLSWHTSRSGLDYRFVSYRRA